MCNSTSKLILTIQKAGSLSNILKFQSNAIESLSLSGPINGTDFKAIRDLKELEYLDLSNCKLVGGGRSYTIIDHRVKKRCIAKADELSDYLLVHMEGCKEYKEVILPEGLNRIGKFALAGHNALKTITIPDSIVEIDDSAFDCCCGLIKINLGKNLKRIGDGAFWLMHSLTEFVIPSSVEYIGKTSMVSSKLEKIKVLNPTPPKLKMDYFTFPGLKQLNTFRNEKVKRSKLNPFNTNTNTCKLIVPKGSLTRYKRAAGWKDFKNITVE